MARAPVKGIDTLDDADLAAMAQMRASDDGAPTIAPPADQDEARAPETAADDFAQGADQGADTAPARAIDPDDYDFGAETQSNAEHRVPYGALAKERATRRELERKLAELEASKAADGARADERMKLLLAAAQGPQVAAPAPVEDPLPDLDTDPIGHFKALSERQSGKLEALSAAVRAFEEQQRQEAQLADLRNWGAAQEQAFAKEEPTYNEAMNFLRQQRADELSKLGITDPVQQAQVLGQDLHAIAQQTRMVGGDFARTLYALAQARGFKKAAPVAAVPPLNATLTADPAVAAERLRRGQASAATLGTAGAAPGVRMTPEQIANLSEAQFGALIDKMRGDPAALRQLLGD